MSESQDPEQKLVSEEGSWEEVISFSQNSDKKRESGDRLWEVDHPYYCEKSNYYVGHEPKVYPWGVDQNHVPGNHARFDSWEDFGWKDSDPEYNLLFRWDWIVPDPECPEQQEELVLFWMLQRKGAFWITSFPVTKEQEPEIKDWLKERYKAIKAVWEPLA
jgi:hypothetical protein